MTTPNGGAYSTVIAMLGGVEIDDPAKADYLEILEHAEDGTVIARTYAGTIVDGPVSKTYLAEAEQGDDNDPVRADNIKLSWDIRGRDYEPVTTLDDLLVALGLRDDRAGREAIANMLTLPVWRVAPKDLQLEVNKWLSEALRAPQVT